MRAAYFTAIFFSATLSLGAPTVLKDLMSTHSPDTSSMPLSQIGTILHPSPPPPSKHEEYISGALKEHKPSKRLDLPLSNMKELTDNDGDLFVKTLQSQSDMKKLKEASSSVDKLMGDMTTQSNRRIGKRGFEELGVIDHLGRKVLKRGNDFQIQEPADQGRQWGGAVELDDEDDEPFWG
ncbi:uncharacterized protein IL334_002574 [Kwoniella shivajii]|uniref:Uncharacterized protein n=1 Tax=Kwoniella shivajii TaxID=564305 RepID=A0ABZ1CWU1_9TREE|nr:hypothetical protein IL334_002574 [Kwoniella shivajii]